MGTKNHIMNTQIFTLLVVVFLSVSSNNQTNEKSTTPSSKNYEGPIIDMHIHAFNEGSPFFGMTHPPTLRGETFQGVASSREQKEETFERFQKYNIVKAMVSNGHLWFDELPETILIGRANIGIDDMRIQHQEGDLQVIAEMAPFYEGVLADDPSQLPYFELAHELEIPVGFHIFPGGPNYGFHLIP